MKEEINGQDEDKYEFLLWNLLFQTHEFEYL